jgi:hypothetical protein
MSPLGRRTVHRVIFIAVAVAAIVVVVLLALIAGGILVVPSSSASPVTITSVRLIIVEGNTAAGVPWFGPDSINETNGYPLQVAPGGSWSVPWSFLNFDNVSHSVYKVIPTSVPVTSSGTSFTIAGYYYADISVTLPYTVPAGEDASLSIRVTTPNEPGSTFAVTLTVDTVSVS